MPIKKILVTGCSGFIGRKVAMTAIEKGYQVSGIDIKECDIPGVEFEKINITDSEGVIRAAEGTDSIIHLAAVTSNLEFEKNLKRSYEVNVQGFANVIEAAIKNKCKRFLYASSSAVYIDSFSEDSVIDIRKQRNHYAKTKIMNEIMAQSYSDLYGLSAVGMRFFNVYGEGENDKGNYASIINLFFNQRDSGKPITVYGDGRQSRDLINVDDVAEIAMKLIDKGDEEIYNIGTGESIPYREIAGMIGGRNVEYVKNPLSSYQYLTRADTRKLMEAIGRYRFISCKEWIMQKIEEKYGK
jgi:UDP-glucose 4-epimerase